MSPLEPSSSSARQRDRELGCPFRATRLGLAKESLLVVDALQKVGVRGKANKITLPIPFIN